LGMKMSHNIALAKISLAGISMAKRNKREAQMYLSEATKDDKNKLLTEQIKMMKAQMAQMDKQQVVRGGFRQFLNIPNKKIDVPKTGASFLFVAIF